MSMPPNEGPGFFESARQRGEEMRRQQSNQQVRANNGGCIAAAVVCTLMVCVTAVFIAWLIYG